MDPPSIIHTIFIRLPEEATDCYFPARAEHLRDDRYRILDEAPADPVWKFGRGDVVRCHIRKLAERTTLTEELVAYEISN